MQVGVTSRPGSKDSRSTWECETAARPAIAMAMEYFIVSEREVNNEEQ